MSDKERLEGFIKASAKASYNKVLQDVICALDDEINRYPIDSEEAKKIGFKGDPEKLFYKIVGLNRAKEIVNDMVIKSLTIFHDYDCSGTHGM